MILNTEQKAHVIVKPLTAKGSPAVVDGPPGWSVSNPSILSLDISPDGLSANVIAGSVGSAFVVVSADADLTPGIREITGSFNVTVVSAEATWLDFDIGSPIIK